MLGLWITVLSVKNSQGDLIMALPILLAREHSNCYRRLVYYVCPCSFSLIMDNISLSIMDHDLKLIYICSFLFCQKVLASKSW